MNEKDLRRLLHVEDTAGRRGWRCPDVMQLAAYAEHRLSTSDEAKIESHAADCPACLDQLAFLARRPVADDGVIAPGLLARARDLVPSRRRAWPRLVPHWAAVAVGTAFVVLLVRIELREANIPPLPTTAPPVQNEATSPRPPAAPPAQAPASSAGDTKLPAAAPPAIVRQSAPRPLALRVVSPTENATLPSRDLEFRWEAVGGAAYYEIHVVTEDGNVAWQDKVESTSTRLGGGASLQPGARYFVWVRAYLSGGGTIRSEAVSFRAGR